MSNSHAILSGYFHEGLRTGPTLDNKSNTVVWTSVMSCFKLSRQAWLPRRWAIWFKIDQIAKFKLLLCFNFRMSFLRYKPGLLFYIYSFITRNLYPHNPASLRLISDDRMIKMSQTRTSATENLRPSVSFMTFWLIHSKGKTSNG